MKTYLFAIVSVLLITGCGGDHRGAIEASGTLEAVEVVVSAKVPGQIQQLNIQEGYRVAAGDTLAILDRTTLDLQWKLAQAGVDLAEAQYSLLQNGARSEDLSQAEEMLRQVGSSFRSAKDDLLRMKELYASNSITKKQYDDAETRYTIAEAQQKSAEQNLQKLQRFARPEELAAARARCNQATATADLIHKQFTDACIVAPVGGIITHKPVEEGELISMGTSIATISRLEQLHLVIYLNELELGKIKLGASTDVVIDSHPEKNFPAKVIYISPIAEFTPKNVQTKEDRTKLVFAVKLDVENPEGILKPGMPADAYIR
jgi:HlyD family secretion protein